MRTGHRFVLALLGVGAVAGGAGCSSTSAPVAAQGEECEVTCPAVFSVTECTPQSGGHVHVRCGVGVLPGAT